MSDNSNNLPINEAMIKMALPIFGGVEGLKQKVGMMVPFLEKGCREALTRKREQYQDKMKEGEFTSLGYNYVLLPNGSLGFLLQGAKFSKKDEPRVSKPFEVLTTKQFLEELLAALQPPEE